VESVYAERGRIDAVFHGAGIIEDRSYTAKQRAGFEQVIATKLGGALSLAKHLRRDLRLCVFFGSVSGVYGNRGQVDYAAANDALDYLASALCGRFAGPTVTLDFGPWSGAGMVTPELAREYERRDIPLIPLKYGIAEISRALFEGNAESAASSAPAHWVVTAAPPEAFTPDLATRSTSHPALLEDEPVSHGIAS
jgi:NAD(P)-dependent dehydrogenase (short-subunit alcohol dehydrogenase family)